MKIVFIIGVNNVGGAEYVSYHHALIARKNGLEITVLSGTTGMYYDMIRNAGIKTHVVGLSPSPRILEPFLKECEVVFNCNSFNATPAIVSLKEKYRFKYFTIIHSNINWVYDQLSKYDKSTDGYYAIHQKIVDSFSAKGVISKNKFTVIPNCVETNNIAKNETERNAVRELYGFGTDDFVIGMITRIAPDKNVMDALKIIKYLPERIKARLLIVGGAAQNESSIWYEKRLRAKIEELRLTRQVVITGNLTPLEVYKKMQAFDVGLNCSPSEGLPISLLEMMGAGITCVMPGFGEIPDVLDISRGLVIGIRQRLTINEILAEPCYQEWEIQNFATAINLLHDHKQVREKMGKNAAKYIASNRSMEVQEKMFLKFLDSEKKEDAKRGTIDVVYVLGTGSNWANNEVRMSIRSFVKHFKDLRNVVLVGECPEFLRGVIHIPYPDQQGVNKDARMMLKIMAACRDSRVSDNFILCTDDTALLDDLNFSDFKGWHEGQIIYNAKADLEDHKNYAPPAETREPSDWFKFVYATGEELKKRGLPDNNYDKAHSPQPINKLEFIEIMSGWDMMNNHYTISNIYNNSSKLFTGEKIKGRNLKIYGKIATHQINELSPGKVCINYNDNALNESLKSWLYKTYSEPTNYETFADGDDRRKAASEWFNKGCNYEEGLNVIKHFAPKNRHLIRYFETRHNNEAADIKLKKTLELWIH